MTDAAPRRLLGPVEFPMMRPQQDQVICNVRRVLPDHGPEWRMIAVKVINDYGDEVMKVFKVEPGRRT